ncbi:MAG: restriction endonuclease subunit S [Gammaproteobacteria bacterium]|nr:MAG: restriction endonuclease subunit S [Gammaproteobacteria bacterium]
MAREAALSRKYATYPKYKDSVVEWLEKIPEHWGTSKLRYMFSFGKGLTITKANLLDEGIPCVNYGEIHSKYPFEVEPATHPLKCVSEQYLKSSQSSLLFQGDMVFADTSEDIDGSGNFTQLTSKQNIFAGYHTIIVRPKDRQSSRFYAYLFDSQEFRTQIRYAVKGVKVFSITQAILRGIDIWLPSLEEQEKIASFLDHETTKIDNLIDKQQQLIKLLKEKRQAVISHAVTKGLNPNAPMRDSDVEWLGEVPEHWEITKIKFIVELTPKKSEIEKQKTIDCSFIPMEKLKTGSLILDESRKIKDVFDGYTYFKDEDILMAKVTPCFENKNMVVARNLVNGIGFGSSEIYVLRAKLNLLNDFLYYRLQEDVFIELATGAMTGAGGLKRVPSDFLNNFVIGLPPEIERIDIVDFVRKYTLKFDTLINKAVSAIELMQERRTALISAAVTGKIDVRKRIAR